MTKMCRSKHIGLVACTALLNSTGISAVHAKTPSGLEDLVGARGSSGESELQARGYEWISTKEGEDRKWSYWWNKDEKQCISVTTYDGRYDAIVETPKADCDKSGGSGKKVAAAVGAAAVIGAIALAASSKKKDKDRDRNYYPNGASDSTPYALRDLVGVRASSGESALNNRGYKFKSWGAGNYSRWAYWWSKRNSQCIAVTTQDGRYEEIVSVPNSYCGKSGGAYRPGQGSSDYGSFVAFEDLNGARASSADSELRQRGFTNVDSFKSGYTAYTIWNRRSSHQCLQMTVAEGRVEDIRDIHTHPKCR